MQNLDKILEGLLFLSGDGVDRGIILEKLQITPKELDKAIEILKKRYDKDCGITFITYKDKLQLCGNQAFADSVSLVLNPIRERQLTRSTLEVMAIIAYKQPVTRLDVQEIRGINSDYAIQTLLNYKLIEVVGRKDAIGKPLLFGTTDEFLRHFGLNSLTDLPDYNELLKSIQQIELQNNHLYNEFEIPDDDSKETEQNGDKPKQEEQPASQEQNTIADTNKKVENTDDNKSTDSTSKNLTQDKAEIQKEQNVKQTKKAKEKQTNKTENNSNKADELSEPKESAEKPTTSKAEQPTKENDSKNVTVQKIDETPKENVEIPKEKPTTNDIATPKIDFSSTSNILQEEKSINTQNEDSKSAQDVAKTTEGETNQDDPKPAPKKTAKKEKPASDDVQIQTENEQPNDGKLDGIDWSLLEDNPDILN